MIKAITENDELVNVKATKDGKLMVDTGEQQEISNNEVKIINTTENAIPVYVQKETETTLNASIQTVGITATTVAINKKVTSIDIANYSETANLTLITGNLNAVIGANIAVTLPINKNVTNISLTSTEADTKVQLIVKGVE